MLAYAYSVLNEDGYKRVTSEHFNNAADLFAAILSKGISNQIKRGLGKGYTNRIDSLNIPTGKIRVSDSIKRQTIIKKQLICEYDDYNENIYINKILKITAKLLLSSKEVSQKNKRMLKKNILYFENVDEINPKRIDWSRIKYHRNNATYRMIINICYLVISGMIISQEDGPRKLSQYIDDQHMHKLYEKFIYQYFKKNYPKLNVSASQIEWCIDDGIIDYLPIMKSDIMIENEEKILIIDAKYYSKTMQYNSMYNSRTIHSSNLYQIFAYVKNKAMITAKEVSGLLLYAKTDEDIIPSNSYLMSGNKISINTLDLNREFVEIENSLNKIAEKIK